MSHDGQDGEKKGSSCQVCLLTIFKELAKVITNNHTSRNDIENTHFDRDLVKEEERVEEEKKKEKKTTGEPRVFMSDAFSELSNSAPLHHTFFRRPRVFHYCVTESSSRRRGTLRSRKVHLSHTFPNLERR